MNLMRTHFLLLKMRYIVALLFIITPFVSLQAEYDEYFIKVYMLTQENDNKLHEHVVYFHSYERPDTTADLQGWRELFEHYSEPDTIGIFYYNLFVYSPVFTGTGQPMGRQYILSDSVIINPERLVEVRFLEIHHGSTLDGLYSKLTLDDMDWVSSPIVDTAFFTAALNVGNETYFDVIYPTFEILIHQRSERVDEILSYLATLKQAYKMRCDQIEMWYGYMNEDCEEFEALVNAYYPMVEQVINLLETEQVVVVYDSGW